MIEEPERRGEIHPAFTIVEYTGGSTGTSLAFVCAVKGYRFKAVSSDAFSPEKLGSMRAFGTELILVPSVQGQITPDLVPRMIEKARELAREPQTYWTDQLNNKDAVKGYRTIGTEILAQTEGAVDAFVAAVGSAGCAMGVSEVLKQANPDIETVIVEPAESPVISTGSAGTHHIEGMGIGFVPPHLRRDLYDDIVTVPTEEAQAMARRLAASEGIFAGSSSGANVVAALRLAERLGPGQTVVTVAVDSGLKYLRTEPFGRIEPDALTATTRAV